MILFILGFAVSFLLFFLLAGRHACDHPGRSIVFSLGQYRLHLHHWMIGLTVLVVLFFLGTHDLFIKGLLCGMVAQGLTYPDRFVIFYRKDQYEKICQKYARK